MNTWGPLAAFGSSLTWAVASAWYSQMARQYSGFTVNFTRALVALPLCVLSAFMGGWSQGVELYHALQWPQVGWLSLSMAAAFGVGDVSFFAASRSLGIPAALSIASCFPIWTLLGSCFLLHQVPSLLQIGGLCLSLLGVITVILSGKAKKGEEVNSCVSLSPSLSRLGSQVPWSGIGFALLASIAWATNSFAAAQGGVGISPHVGNTIRMLSALFFSGLLGHLLARDCPRVIPLKVILPMSGLLVVEAYGGAFFYVYGLSHSPLTLGAVLTSLAPIVSVPVSLIFRLESFSWMRLGGVCLSVVGICILVLSQA